MKKTIKIETEIKYDLTAQDIFQYCKDKNLVPEDWEYYCAEIIGLGVSNGATLIVKQSKNYYE